MSWDRAKEFCILTGGRLASLKDNEFVKILTFINRNELKSGFWMGGHFQNLTWNWTDDTKISPTDLFLSFTYKSNLEIVFKLYTL